MKRTYIDKINNKLSGSISGRIESLGNNEMFISDQSGFINLKFTEIHNFHQGDFVTVLFKKKDNEFNIEKIVLLNRPEKIPDNNSAHYKLNKNDRELLDILKRREMFFYETRKFFKRNNFLELHTPLLVESPGIESYIEPFETTYFDYSGKEKSYYIPTSPEFSLKEALSSGLEKIYEIAKSGRNSGENSNTHNPDFFMLEWYRAFEKYNILINDCKKLILYLSQKIYKSNTITYCGKTCDLTKIKKIRVKDIFNNYKINLDLFQNDPDKFETQIISFYKNKGEYISTEMNKDDMFFKFLLDNVEKTLGFDFPTIIYEYPIDMCALSQKCNNPIYGERFELFLFGIEIANAFGELVNPSVQEANFYDTLNFRYTNKAKIKLEMPDRFIKALNYGLPPCSGIALGLERLFMIFENKKSLKDINLINF